MAGAPQVGDFVRLRTRRWLVEGERLGNQGLRSLRLACVDDDAQGELADILWDAELDAEVLRDDGWAVRGERNQRDTSHHRTQSEAERAARDIAINQRSEVLIHGEDGRIRERNSYGNDPHPPKG